MSAKAVIYVPSDTPEAMYLSLRKVSGVPLIIRGIMSLFQSGIESIVLLLPKTHIEKIEDFLKRYKDAALPKLTFISYDEPYSVSPETIDALSKEIDDHFLMINANLLFYPSLIKACAVRANELTTVNEGAHPLPIFVLTKNLISRLKPFCAQRPRAIESCLNQLLESPDKKELQISDCHDTFLITKRREILVAEKFLSEHIRLSTDGPVARYINKRISLPISQMLARMWISPNTVTVINIIIGVFSGVFMADGKNYWVIFFGAALFQLASIVDGCDGELAKLTFRTSKFGQYLDTISDNLTLGSLLVGITAGYWRHTHSYIAFVLGVLMIAGAGVTLFFMARFLKQNTNSASLVTYDKEFIQKIPKNRSSILMKFVSIAKYAIKKDAYSFAVILLAAFGILYVFLYICTTGAVLSAMIVGYLDWREGRSESAEQEQSNTKLYAAPSR